MHMGQEEIYRNYIQHDITVDVELVFERFVLLPTQK